MKAVKIILILLILLFPSVFASVSLEKFNNEVYNSGDKIFLDGKVSMDKPFRGYLNFVLKCDNSSVKVATLIVDVDKDREQKFAQLMMVPRNVIGECELEATINDEFTNEIVEVSKFVGFRVTNELDGIFQINKKKFQLGGTLVIEGNINKKDGSGASGTATLYFNKGNETLFLDNSAFTNGALDYKKDMDFIPQGNYEIDVEVFDNSGNKRFFDNLYLISVDSDVNINANFDKSLYDPGNNVLLTGSVNGNNNEVLNNIELEFLFDNKDKIKKTLIDSSSYYSVNYPLAKNFKSGAHNVLVVARANGGNYGVMNFNFTVSQIPTKLDLGLDKSSFNPGDEIQFSLGFFDQANDEIKTTLNAALTDNDNKVITSGVFESNGNGLLKVPDGYKPGVLKLQVQGHGLSDGSSINVKEYEKLDASLEGDILKVKNIGNIKYKKPLSVFAGNTEKKKNLNINIGDTEEISLKKLLPDGMFDVKVPAAGKEFKDVTIVKPKSIFSGLGSITGNVAKNVEQPERKFALGFLLLVLLGCVLFLVYFKKNGKSQNFTKQNFDNESRVKNYNKTENYSDPKRTEYVKPAVEYGKATQEDIDDFKRRMTKQFQNDNQKKTWNDFVRQQEKSISEDKPKGGMFNMFN